MFERVLKNTNSYFDEILHQILTPPLNLKIRCRLITHSPHPTIKLPRIQMFKIGFRKLSIVSKLREWRKWQGVGESSCLRHCDALRTKIDMWLKDQFNTRICKNKILAVYYWLFNTFAQAIKLCKFHCLMLKKTDD